MLAEYESNIDGDDEEVRFHSIEDDQKYVIMYLFVFMLFFSRLTETVQRTVVNTELDEVIEEGMVLLWFFIFAILDSNYTNSDGFTLQEPNSVGKSSPNKR